MPLKSQSFRLGLYAFLARLKAPKTFIGKILLIAFLGTHVPLLAFLVYAILTTDLPGREKAVILLVALIATVVGTTVTLWALRQLLAPITLTSQALRRYLEHDVAPDLPVHFADEAGMLMADTTQIVGRLDTALHQLSNFDGLTALPNRKLFVEKLAQSLGDAAHNQRRIAILKMELSGLDVISGGLGTESRDDSILCVAQRMLAWLREGELLARTRDSIFTVLLIGFDSLEQIESRAEELLRIASKPITVGQSEVQLGGAMGIATFPEDGRDPEALLACAESALFSAKVEGRGRFAYFSSIANDALRRRLDIEAGLRGAIERGEFELAYQPIVDVSSGRLQHVEALIRWNRREAGPVGPEAFIPLAEASGQIEEIGHWVLQTACRQARRWLDGGSAPIKVSVNVSARQLRCPGFAKSVADILNEAGLPPSLLQLEVTESAIIEEFESGLATLAEVRRLGVLIALDDFGVGYSSLSHLKRLPIDVVKIDRSFIRGLPNDEHDLAIVDAVVALASTLRLRVVAEGVETLEQSQCLPKHGCVYLQGYFFGKPVLESHLDQAPWMTAHFNQGSSGPTMA